MKNPETLVPASLLGSATQWPALGRIKLRHLLLFRNVCESSSVGRAAATTHMTQPAATKLIHELEDIFGAKLFVRTRQGTMPTVHGNALLRYVRVILADLSAAKEHMDSLSDGGLGAFRLGVIPFVPGTLSATACALLRKEYPRLNISLVEGSSAELIERLRRGELEATLARVSSGTDANGLNIEILYDEPFSAVARRGHAVSKSRSPTWKQLASFDWALPARGSLSRLAIDTAFCRQGCLGPHAVVECQSLEQMRQQVACSDLLGALPHADAAALEKQRVVKIVKAKFAAHVAPVSLVRRKGRDIAPEATRFLELISRVASERASA